MNEMIQKFINTFKKPEQKEAITPEKLGDAYAKSVAKDDLAKALEELLKA
ncbi:hypothetical protein IT409_01110 [Candidatus Falkowbacteria bacterium]|nr:hypothetical protein [Candidatus Falkowbacteria bacterium]